jgi:formate-dependent nitrite reductase membrane component NrfD
MIMKTLHGVGETEFTVDLQAQRHWDWQVAFYLYGAGTSAGLIFLEVVLQGLGVVDQETALWGMWIALGLALVSLGFLFNHLGPRSRWVFFYVFRRPGTSWTARGATMITVLVLLQFLNLLPSVPGFENLPWSEGTVSGMILRGAILLFALAFMAYSGLILSSFNGIAFWNTPALPILYVCYSALCGMAALLLVALITGWGEGFGIAGAVLWPYLLVLLLANAFILLIYVWGMSTGTLPARESVRRLVRGEHRWSFWAGTVGVGLVLPTFVAALTVSGQLGTGTSTPFLLAVTCMAIHVGGFLLRENVLRVGIYGYPI